MPSSRPDVITLPGLSLSSSGVASAGLNSCQIGHYWAWDEFSVAIRLVGSASHYVVLHRNRLPARVSGIIFVKTSSQTLQVYGTEP
jgi:hypothetical protein